MTDTGASGGGESTLTEHQMRQLKDASHRGVSRFTFTGKRFYAKIVKVYTACKYSMVFFYNNELVRHTVRLVECNEVNPMSVRDNNSAINDRDLVESIVMPREPTSSSPNPHLYSGCLVRVHCGAFDDRGRILVHVFVRNPDGSNGGGSARQSRICLNEYLVQQSVACTCDVREQTASAALSRSRSNSVNTSTSVVDANTNSSTSGDSPPTTPPPTASTPPVVSPSPRSRKAGLFSRFTPASSLLSLGSHSNSDLVTS